MIGNVVNALSILAGCLIGVFFGRFLPEKLSKAVQMAVALCVVYIGIDGMLAGENTLITIISLVIGVIIGEILDLDGKIHRLGAFVEKKVAKNNTKYSISEGFVRSTLLFCVGAMAIVGSLEAGLVNDQSTLYAKAVIDGISSVVYASTMGPGVALSALSVFIYQGTITLCSSFLEPLLVSSVIAEMKCVGSILIMGLGFNLLNITDIKVMNFVPAVFLPIILCLFV